MNGSHMFDEWDLAMVRTSDTRRFWAEQLGIFAKSRETSIAGRRYQAALGRVLDLLSKDDRAIDMRDFPYRPESDEYKFFLRGSAARDRPIVGAVIAGPGYRVTIPLIKKGLHGLKIGAAGDWFDSEDGPVAIRDIAATQAHAADSFFSRSGARLVNTRLQLPLSVSGQFAVNEERFAEEIRFPRRFDSVVSYAADIASNRYSAPEDGRFLPELDLATFPVSMRGKALAAAYDLDPGFNVSFGQVVKEAPSMEDPRKMTGQALSLKEWHEVLELRDQSSLDRIKPENFVFFSALTGHAKRNDLTRAPWRVPLLSRFSWIEGGLVREAEFAWPDVESRNRPTQFVERTLLPMLAKDVQSLSVNQLEMADGDELDRELLDRLRGSVVRFRRRQVVCWDKESAEVLKRFFVPEEGEPFKKVVQSWHYSHPLLSAAKDVRALAYDVNLEPRGTELKAEAVEQFARISEERPPLANLDIADESTARIAESESRRVFTDLLEPLRARTHVMMRICERVYGRAVEVAGKDPDKTRELSGREFYLYEVSDGAFRARDAGGGKPGRLSSSEGLTFQTIGDLGETRGTGRGDCPNRA